MSEQTNLFEEPEPERPLTEIQQFALDELRRFADGLSSDELGAVLHERKRRLGGRGHERDLRCEFCTSEGERVGKALRARGLVRKRHGRCWQALDGVMAGPTIGPGDLPIGF